MRIFIWEREDHVTQHYYHEGGIICIASGLRAARNLIKTECPTDCNALVNPPDFTLDCEDTEPRIFIFPDSGCC